MSLTSRNVQEFSRGIEFRQKSGRVAIGSGWENLLDPDIVLRSGVQSLLANFRVKSGWESLLLKSRSQFWSVSGSDSRIHPAHSCSPVIGSSFFIGMLWQSIWQGSILIDFRIFNTSKLVHLRSLASGQKNKIAFCKAKRTSLSVLQLTTISMVLLNSKGAKLAFYHL